MSIFQKDCPQCAAPNPVSAVRCACGHCFDIEAVTDKKAAVEVAIHEERLYHDYLAARVVQAEAVYEVARADALAEPGNTLKAANALAAEQALNAARAELQQQARKTARLKQAAQKTAVQARPATRPVAIRATARAARRKSAALAPPANAPTTIPATASAPAASAVAPTAPPAVAPARAAVVPTQKKQARATSATHARTGLAPVKLAQKPSRAFRARQAKQADAIARKVHAGATATPAIEPPALLPTASYATPTAIATRECPNCTAKVPATTARCRCGFGFAAASFEMASLPLDAAALEILRR